MKNQNLLTNYELGILLELVNRESHAQNNTKYGSDPKYKQDLEEIEGKLLVMINEKK